MTLPRCLQPFAQFIEEVSNEDNGYWVYLVRGWLDPDGETHCIHEDTPEECAELMQDIVKCEIQGCCQ